jgi:nicotinamidase/pyrazinamidase
MEHETRIDTLRLHVDDALLIVDLQRDFLPGGSLAVPGGEAIVTPVQACIARFLEHRLPIFASRDWHPAGHCSFRASGGPWPPHCVAGSRGAGFAPALRLPPHVVIVDKGTTRGHDDYSAFGHTELHARLRENHVLRLFVGGLATDYCVRSTVLDGLALGYRVVVLGDAIAAVDMQPGDGDRALQQMRDAGALVATSHDLH